ncbi:hypothetical protein BDN71DRAFT_1456235 [Pleurotus eryngii]|uniref:Uncharacterized protein n=1 Tax=Pleurotus eryngii TaxID=5323 RepID=A0A9P6D372_PLEER|nr:hypothetical protein BDN71DRAFT_1456235 [Pleurotus eryngii]
MANLQNFASQPGIHYGGVFTEPNAGYTFGQVCPTNVPNNQGRNGATRFPFTPPEKESAIPSGLVAPFFLPTVTAGPHGPSPGVTAMPNGQLPFATASASSQVPAIVDDAEPIQRLGQLLQKAISGDGDVQNTLEFMQYLINDGIIAMQRLQSEVQRLQADHQHARIREQRAFEMFQEFKNKYDGLTVEYQDLKARGFHLQAYNGTAPSRPATEISTDLGEEATSRGLTPDASFGGSQFSEPSSQAARSTSALDQASGPPIDMDWTVNVTELSNLTPVKLQTHSLAKYVTSRRKPRGMPPSALFQFSEAQKEGSTAGVYPGNESRTNFKCLRWADGQIDVAERKRLAGTISGHAKTIAIVMVQHRINLGYEASKGKKFYQLHARDVWEGAVALLEGIHPILRLCADHYKAETFLVAGLATVEGPSNDHPKEPMPPGSSRPRGTCNPSKGPQGAAAARKQCSLSRVQSNTADPSRTSPPLVEHRRSPTTSPKLQSASASTVTSLPTTTPSTSTNPLFSAASPPALSPSRQRDSSRPEMGTVATRTPHRLSSPQQSNAPPTNITSPYVGFALRGQQFVASPMKAPAKRNAANTPLKISTALKKTRLTGSSDLEMSKPNSPLSNEFLNLDRPLQSLKPPKLKSGRKIVDLSHIEVPITSYLEQQQLSVRSEIVTNITALEDNTDSQWGHGIYTSALMDAGLKDWATIGSAAFAVELMATGIRISEVARQLCQTRNVRLPERFLADDYLDMMVSRIQKAWIESGGEAPVTANATNLSSSKSEPSRPRPKPKAKPRSAAKSAPSGSTASVDAVVQPGSASHADIDTLVANKINSVEAIITTLNLTESLKVLSAVGKDMARSSRRAVVDGALRELYEDNEAQMLEAARAEYRAKLKGKMSG